MPLDDGFGPYLGAGVVGQTAMLTRYLLELRAALGFDTGLNPTVLIRVAPDHDGNSQRGSHTWLLDMTPDTRTVQDAGLAVGQTFVDPDTMPDGLPGEFGLRRTSRHTGRQLKNRPAKTKPSETKRGA